MFYKEYINYSMFVEERMKTESLGWKPEWVRGGATPSFLFVTDTLY